MTLVEASPAALERARSSVHNLALRPGLSVRAPLGPVPAGYPPDSPTAASKSTVDMVDRYEGAPVCGRAAIVAATAAGREILPVGTKLDVYWEGCEEWFSTQVLGHTAQLKEGHLVFKHQCEYEGGHVEHDLGDGALTYSVTAMTSEAIPEDDERAVEEASGSEAYARNYEAKTIATPGADAAQDENSPTNNAQPQGPTVGSGKKGRVGLRRSKPRGQSKLQGGGVEKSAIQDAALYI